MAAVSKIEQDVVELRTDVGRLYVRPTGWQRLYLRWTFRNFHSLSLQILNRRQKQLIENLSRSAILTPAEHVPATAVIGIVENMTVLALPSTAEMAEATTAVKPALADAHLAVLQGGAEDAALESSIAAPEQEGPAAKPAAQRPVTPEIFHEFSTEHAASEHDELSEHAPQAEHGRGEQTGQRKPWASAFALAGAAAALLLAFWLAPLARLPQLSITPAPAPQAPPLVAIEKPAAPAAALPVKAAAQRANLAVQGSSAARPAATNPQLAKKSASAAALAAKAAAVPDSAPLPQIEEAPRSGFIYPVAPNPNLVGKVVLKAVVGSDGAVKQVEVLSGERALASAAVRAVRQWRYAPPQVDGHTVEAETHVTISFLGDDAVSIILPPSR
ncbi:MAG TPA: energy transducer TonB [Terriglobales bacterium]|nr:energy transducer TonB [Terriglobales bacterium]